MYGERVNGLWGGVHVVSNVRKRDRNSRERRREKERDSRSSRFCNFPTQQLPVFRSIISTSPFSPLPPHLPLPVAVPLSLLLPLPLSVASPPFDICRRHAPVRTPWNAQQRRKGEQGEGERRKWGRGEQCDTWCNQRSYSFGTARSAVPLSLYTLSTALPLLLRKENFHF